MPLSEKNMYTVKTVMVKSQGTRDKFSFKQISLLAYKIILYSFHRKSEILNFQILGAISLCKSFVLTGFTAFNLL